jgi:peptidoglycan/LPS O-acetylase OafA/YrhL
MIGYRREIDGLRALAILPILLFHAGFKTFSGGFVGVDVFFVISGYLITTIIVRERQENSFSLLAFYERRARRILPALFLMMAVCMLSAWVCLLPKDMLHFSKSIKAVALFFPTIFFTKRVDTSTPLVS